MSGIKHKPDDDAELPEAPFEPEWDSRHPCEFCGREYMIDVVHHAVGHEMPYCAEFAAMDVIEFLRANNQRKLAKVPRA